MFAFASTEKRRNGLLPQVFLPFVSCALARSILESVVSELISPSFSLSLSLSLSFITYSPLPWLVSASLQTSVRGRFLSVIWKSHVLSSIPCQRVLLDAWLEWGVPGELCGHVGPWAMLEGVSSHPESSCPIIEAILR